MHAGVVDVCLIPEVKFELAALTAYVRQVMKRKGHCVICIAEGAGQDIVQHGHAGTDKSGNPILKDIGTHLRDSFKESMEVRLSFSGRSETNFQPDKTSEVFLVLIFVAFICAR